MSNLDFLCMQTAQGMVAVEGGKNDKENLVTKSLGVLMENGPYGMMLYLEVQKKQEIKKIAREFRGQLLGLLQQGALRDYIGTLPPTNGDFQAICRWLQTAANSLDTYLFIKRLWQQTLTYARYQAKALGEEAEPSKRN